MFKKTQPVNVNLEDAITDCYKVLKTQLPDSKEHAATVRQIVELEKHRDSNKSKGISPDTILLVAANILGILLVLNYERAGVVTSKAFGMIGKVR